jgi:hypothetical protein
MAEKKQSSAVTGGQAAAAVGLTAAVAAAAAGAYFLYGAKDAAKNRKKVSGWMLTMKGEVLNKMEKLKDVNEDAYNKIVDEASRRYQGIKNVDPVELAKMISEMKSHWKSIHKQFNGITKRGGVKKAAKKAVKAVVKKASEKSDK